MGVAEAICEETRCWGTAATRSIRGMARTRGVPRVLLRRVPLGTRKGGDSLIPRGGPHREGRNYGGPGPLVKPGRERGRDEIRYSGAVGPLAHHSNCEAIRKTAEHQVICSGCVPAPSNRSKRRPNKPRRLRRESFSWRGSHVERHGTSRAAQSASLRGQSNRLISEWSGGRRPPPTEALWGFR